MHQETKGLIIGVLFAIVAGVGVLAYAQGYPPAMSANSGVTLDTTQTISGQKTLSARTYFADGSEALPGIAFGSDTDTGIFRSGANGYSLVTGGVARVAVSSTEVQFTVPTVATDVRIAATTGRFCFDNSCSGGRILDWDGANPRFQGGLKIQGSNLLLHNGVDVEWNNSGGGLKNTSAGSAVFVDDAEGLKFTPTATASLPTCDATLASAITYDSTLNKHVGCNNNDGSYNWDPLY